MQKQQVADNFRVLISVMSQRKSEHESDTGQDEGARALTPTTLLTLVTSSRHSVVPELLQAGRNNRFRAGWGSSFSLVVPGLKRRVNPSLAVTRLLRRMPELTNRGIPSFVNEHSFLLPSNFYLVLEFTRLLLASFCTSSSIKHIGLTYTVHSRTPQTPDPNEQ